ncbi:MAG TPA: ABC transporter permease, partial [Chitinophagales bacterium]
YWRILTQSLRLSLEEISTSKLRSYLSLMGVAIGVLCVVSVRTAVTSLDKNIRSSFASLGTDILYIQKWPWIWSDDYPWWRYVNRPNSNEREMNRLAQTVHSADAVALINFASSGKTAKYYDRSVDEVKITAATRDYNLIKNLDFTQGRYFTQNEFNSGSHICVLGANIAETLFGNGSVDLKEIRLGGIKMKVIGALKKEGDDMFGFSMDNTVLIPYNSLSLFESDGNDPLLALKPKEGIAFDEMKYEARGAMRAIRRLAPNQEDNFALNKMSVFVDGLSSILDFVGFAGMIIG